LIHLNVTKKINKPNDMINILAPQYTDMLVGATEDDNLNSEKIPVHIWQGWPKLG